MTWFFIALTSAFLSAAAAISQKKVLFKLTAVEFSFLISIFNVVLSVPFLFYIDSFPVSTEGILILVFKSLIGSTAFLCIMLALKNLEISNALPLLALTPGVIAIIAYFFIGEALKQTEIIGLVLLISGTYVLESKFTGDLLHPFKTFYRSKFHHYILIAIMLMSVSSILDKVLLKQYNFTPILLTVSQQIIYAVFFSIAYLLTSHKTINKIISESRNEFLLVIIIAVLTLGYRYSQALAISLAPVSLVIAVKRTSVFWATIVGGKIFSDKHLLRKSIAVVIIIAGAMLILRD